MRTKYILIERGPEYKKTAVSRIVAEDIQRRGNGIIGAPVTMKQIKEQRLHVYKDEHYFRHMAENDFHEVYETGTVFKATVTWFDRSSGSGSVLIQDGSEHGMMMPLYACNLPGRKTWFPETACTYYEPKTEIEVTIECGLVVSHTPALLDLDRWNSLDQDRLAFKCNEQGEAINGLFSTKK